MECQNKQKFQKPNKKQKLILLSLIFILKKSMISNKRELVIPRVQPVKFVEKGNGTIKGYAVNTFHGMVKDYNEDRVSIIMNITKPNYKGKWPKCSYFGVFDGHGGDACSNFLKDNMHKYITENQYFPVEPIQALKAGFKKAQNQFMKLAEAQNPPEKSGSCAIVILIIDQICYIANVGDSRAILSSERGSKVYSLSYDHKPDSPMERSRIQKANGKIYQSIIKTKSGISIPGPFRINPGKLSVSRSFGDIEAKVQKYGGNPKVLIAKPQITYFQINSQIHDFVILGSDGIFDKLTNQEIAQCFWQRHSHRRNNNDYIGEASSKILTQSMTKMSMDNLTSLIIVFQDHGRLELPRKKSKIYEQSSMDVRSQKQKERQREKEREREREKQNSHKQGQNILKNDKQYTSKIVDKMTMRRKSANHQTYTQQLLNNKSKDTQKQNRKGSSKMLRKDNTMKVLPSHKALKMELRQTQQEKDYNISSLTKILKLKNIDKIR